MISPQGLTVVGGGLFTTDDTKRELLVGALSSFLVKKVIPECPRGFTFDPRSWSLPRFGEKEYIVSLIGHERRFTGSPGRLAIRAWLCARFELLRRSDNYIGGWRNHGDGLFYLDLSVAVRGRKPALELARKRGQLSIYQPTRDRTIVVT